jgi:hypothetical protein
MNTTHTPEPLGFDKNDEDNLFVFSKAKICNLYNTIGTEYDEAEANAARIVACVNACTGMEDPAAEINQLKAQRDDLIKQRADLIIQRAALLEAIKSHVDLYNAGLLTDPQKLEEHTLKLAEIYTDIINA